MKPVVRLSDLKAKYHGSTNWSEFHDVGNGNPNDSPEDALKAIAEAQAKIQSPLNDPKLRYPRMESFAGRIAQFP
jgi:hypothetical protein